MIERRIEKMCADCCVSCCYSTPPITWGTIGFIIFGMVGFLISCIYGIVEFSSFIDEKGTIVVAPIVAGLIVFTVLPIVMATILAYFVTGYIRDVLFHSCVKSYIGAPCSIFTMVLTFLYFLVWLVAVVGLSAVMALYLQAVLLCHQRDSQLADAAVLPSNGTDCFPFVDPGFSYSPLCGDDLNALCDEGLKVGLAFSIGLFFALIVAIGLVVMLVIEAANYVAGRENMQYRQANYPRNDEYFMKRVH